jgi:hypothetical protein
MEISTINILKPSEGNYLTQANRNENDEPIMSLQVINGDADKWVKIPIEEGDAIMAQWRAEQEKRMQAEMNNATR